MKNIAEEFIETVVRRFYAYKQMGDKTFAQLNDADLHFQPNEASNSIAIIIQHVAGNMLSRWTNFITEDGEKEWRNRDAEFEVQYNTREQLVDAWEKGWKCMFDALAALTADDLQKTVYIRREALSVIDAIHRQLAHYSYHVGQIVYVGRLIKDVQWQSLSIPKGQSQAYNQNMETKA